MKIINVNIIPHGSDSRKAVVVINWDGGEFVINGDYIGINIKDTAIENTNAKRVDYIGDVCLVDKT